MRYRAMTESFRDISGMIYAERSKLDGEAPAHVHFGDLRKIGLLIRVSRDGRRDSNPQPPSYAGALIERRPPWLECYTAQDQTRAANTRNDLAGRDAELVDRRRSSPHWVN